MSLSNRQSALTLVSIILLLGAVPASSQAQQFSFGFSTGGGHCHHGCYGGYWGGPYWGPPGWGPSVGVIYAPPPVIQQRVVYIDPPRVTGLPPRNTAIATTSPTTNGSLVSDGTSADSRITIRNGAGQRLPVTFLLDGQDLELADGAAQTFVGSSRRTITYDRGGHFGSTQQDLATGDYEFRITPTGWDLVRKPDLPAASRTARANPLPER